MKYQYYKIDNIVFIEADNEHGLKIVISPTGAAIYAIYFDGEIMNVTPKDKLVFMDKKSKLGKSVGPISPYKLINKDDIYQIDGKEYKYLKENKDIEYVISHFLFNNKPILDTHVFSGSYVFKKKKMKDGLPGNIQYFISYAISDYSNEIYIDVKALSDSTTPMSIHNELCFSLGSKNLNELYLTIPTNQVIDQGELQEVNKELDFRKKKNVSTRVGGYDNFYRMINKEPIILENSKYKMELNTDYEYVKIETDNNEVSYESLQNDNKVHRGVKIIPHVNPLEENYISKAKRFHQITTIKFYKK